MKNLFLALICLLLSSSVLAQKSPKFGKLSSDLVKMSSFPVDSSADAIILLDYGTTTFRYTSESGFVYDFKRIIRIKIITKDGLKHGDFNIPYYSGNSSVEKITGIKGLTYNYSKGNILKSKLEKTSIFNEQTTKHWSQKKISMPDVKAGSVIEISYTKTSPFFWNLVDWQFQYNIPTIYSEYLAVIPEYFNFQLLQTGYITNINFNKSTSKGSVRLHAGALESIDFDNNIYHWVAKNVPAFKEEPYITSPQDFISKIKFELVGTHFPNSGYREYMGTWESLNKSFLDNTHFEEALKLTGFMKDELERINALNSSEEKVVTLTELIRNQVEWNDINSLYINTSLRKSWMDKKGNCADINLMIVAGLRKLGFKAEPILISTRNHGMIRENFALANQFNYVIAFVELNDKMMLLDGTDRYLPVGVLPKRCLNNKGWRVSKTNPGWVPIKPITNQVRITQAKLVLTQSGELGGTFEVSSKGYSGYASNKKIKLEGESKYFEEIEKNHPHWTIEDYEYYIDEDFSKPFKSKYEVELNEGITVAGDKIYLNPTLGEVMQENIFKLKEREYPVDYAYPIRQAYMFEYKLPDNYTVEEAPSSTAFAMPQKSAIFSYSISSNNNILRIFTDFKINRSVFTQLEYPILKKFYDQVVAKCEEQVVLKKLN